MVKNGKQVTNTTTKEKSDSAASDATTLTTDGTESIKQSKLDKSPRQSLTTSSIVKNKEEDKIEVHVVGVDVHTIKFPKPEESEAWTNVSSVNCKKTTEKTQVEALS